MPQITVDYSYTLEDAFDQEGFVRALHEATVEIAAAKPEACKTMFRCAEFTVVGYGDPDDQAQHAIIHVTLGLLAGRSEETKAKLTEAVLDLLRKYVGPEDGRLYVSAEIRDLDPSYRKFER
jgi:5-carboxymethyl-2-hydroxymuconate isomerase